jgi:hypothetical protein
MGEGCLIDASIYSDCLRHLAEIQADFVVKDSIPIPFFGNLSGYLGSPLRVVTAALNPSDREFPPNNPRFHLARGRRGPVDLEAELSAYFDFNPYCPWFRAFEPVLNGLGASYGGKMARQDFASTALHLDMCSPIATCPTWSRLSPSQRAVLTSTGREIFERLVDELEPHIIVASLGWGHLGEWNANFRAGRSWRRIAEYGTEASGAKLKSPLLVQVGRVSSRKERSTPFVNASAANTPFGRFTTARKLETGQMLRDWLSDGGNESDGPS